MIYIKNASLIDLHNDLAFHIFFKNGYTLKGPNRYSEMDLEKFKDGNVKGSFLCYLDS